MQHFPLSTAINNLPSYRNFIYTGGSEDMSNESLPNALFQQNMSDSADLFFRRDFNWEYFSNELEFE
jgi:hypothetical protein